MEGNYRKLFLFYLFKKAGQILDIVLKDQAYQYNIQQVYQIKYFLLKLPKCLVRGIEKIF